MTRDGFVPISEIAEGTEVCCHGKWLKAPKPVMGKAVRCSFDMLPTTCFEASFLEAKEVSVCHNMILRHDGKWHPGLAVRAYTLEYEKKRNYGFVISGEKMLSYWYPYVIDYYGCMTYPSYNGKKKEARSYTFPNGGNPEHRILSGDELSERNLEYYLEGMLRRHFHWDVSGKGSAFFSMGRPEGETARLVVRLLDIGLRKRRDNSKSQEYVITNGKAFLSHVRDDLTKSKITDEMICFVLRNFHELPPYTGCIPIRGREECEEWILPGICPDVNGISPIP